MRGEDRLDRVASSLAGDRSRPTAPQQSSSSSSRGAALPPTAGGGQGPADATAGAAQAAAANFTIDKGLAESGPTTKDEGRAAWEDFLRERFVRGGDDDFDYAPVDEDEGLDELECRDREEEWFDGEEPEWASDGSDGSGGEDAVGGGSGGEPGRRKGPKERVLTGQTGVQDY